MKKLKQIDLHSIVSGSALAFSLRLVGALLLFVQDAAMGRWLGANGYGTFVLFRSLFVTAALILLLGFDVSSLKFASVYANEKELPRLQGFLLWSQTTVFLITCLATTILFLYGVSLSFQDHHDLSMTLFAGAGLIPVVALLRLQQGFLRGLGHISYALLPEEIIVPLITLFFMTTFLLSSKLTSFSCMLAFDLANAAGLAASFILLKKMTPRLHANSRIYEWRLWLQVSIPILFSHIAAQLLGQTEIFLLGKFRLMSEVGLFNVANRVAAAPVLPYNIVALVVSPIIAREFNAGVQLELKKIVKIGSTLSLLGALLVSLPLLAAPDFFLGLFGQEFLASKVAFFLLLAGNLLNVYYGLNSHVLVMTGHEVFLVKVLGFSLLFDVCLGLALIPQGGIVGAAIASTATKLVRNVILDIACRTKVGVSPCFTISITEIRSFVKRMS